MKKVKYATLLLASLMGITACGNNIIHEVDQELIDTLPSSVVTIKFWHCLGQEKTKNLVKVVDAFNTKYEGHFKVELAVPGGSTYDGLHTAVKTRLASGNVPALTMGYPDSFSEYMGTKLNGSNILRLNNFLEDNRTIEVNKIVKDETTGKWVVEKDGAGNPVKEELVLGYSNEEFADFVEPYREEGRGYQFDGYWSLPMYKSTEVMFYNYDYFMGMNSVNELHIFAEGTEYADEYWELHDAVTAVGKYYSGDAGHELYRTRLAALKTFVDSHGGVSYDVPTTWNEMFTLAQKMRADRAAVGEPNTNFVPVGYDSDANLIISQMMQRGIPYTSNENIESKADHLLFKNDQAAALLNEIKGYIDNSLLCTKYSLDATGGTYTNTKFGDWECVMSIGSTGGSDYQVSDDFAVEVAPVPYYGATPKYVQQGPSICFFDNENPKITTGAWLFYKMLADPDMNTALATENSYDPVRISSIESPSYAEFIAEKNSALLNYVPTITHLPQIANNQFTTPVFIGSSKCRSQMAELILNMVHKNKSASEALQIAYDTALNATKK